MIRQPHVFVHQRRDVRRQKFTLFAATLQQDAPDDADGALSVLLDFLHVVLEVCRDFLHFFGVFLLQLLGGILYQLHKVVEQFARHLGEVDDEIQRVLYLMCDTGREHSQRRHLLLLMQLLFKFFDFGHSVIVNSVNLYFSDATVMLPPWS